MMIRDGVLACKLSILDDYELFKWLKGRSEVVENGLIKAIGSHVKIEWREQHKNARAPYNWIKSTSVKAVLDVGKVNLKDARKWREYYEFLMHCLWCFSVVFYRVFRSQEYLEYERNRFQECVQRSREDTPEARRKRLKDAPKKPESFSAITTVFRRNPDVAAEVLERAKGFCENEKCRKPAPFLKAKDSSPYLEVHHKIPLAQGGDDTVENAIALCPNCHREAHFGSLKF